jgi:hypothetical protein
MHDFGCALFIWGEIGMKRIILLFLVAFIIVTIAVCSTSGSKPATEPTITPTIQPATQPTTESAFEKVTYPTTEPIAEPTTVPSSEPTTKPTIQPSKEPATEPTTAPSTEPTTESPTDSTEPSDEIIDVDYGALTDKYIGRWYLSGYGDVYIDVAKKTQYYNAMSIWATNYTFPYVGASDIPIIPGYTIYPQHYVDTDKGAVWNPGCEIPFDDWDNALTSNRITLSEESITINAHVFIKTPGSITDSSSPDTDNSTDDSNTAPTTCNHIWTDATCTAPKTCQTCGDTEGDAASHTWSDATCSAPKTCNICGATEGSTAEHSWSDATCIAPKSCIVCGTTEGSAAGHNWNDATCTMAKTCSICNVTDGEPLEHSYVEESNTTNSVITYRCTMCGQIKENTVEPLSVSAYRSSSASLNNLLSEVGYAANGAGGCGKYQYKFEVYSTESSDSPTLIQDFSDNNRFRWSSPTYCNGNVLIITVQDEAGNEARLKIVVDTVDRID